MGTEATGSSIGAEGGHSLGFGGNGVLGIKVSIEEKEHALARAQSIVHQSGILQPVANDAHKDICGLGIVNRKEELAGGLGSLAPCYDEAIYVANLTGHSYRTDSICSFIVNQKILYNLVLLTLLLVYFSTHRLYPRPYRLLRSNRWVFLRHLEAVASLVHALIMP